MILDPTEVRIGRNVGIGYGTTIAGHLLTRGEIQFAPTLIEDDVQIGGHSVIPGGVTLRRGSVIGIHSYVKPGTVVGENEFWAGVPARFIKSVTPHGDPGPPAGSGSV
jgi:acetyltransferase-like isoleucine patch superfamily enzyme